MAGDGMIYNELSCILNYRPNTPDESRQDQKDVDQVLIFHTVCAHQSYHTVCHRLFHAYVDHHGVTPSLPPPGLERHFLSSVVRRDFQSTQTHDMQIGFLEMISRELLMILKEA